MFPPAEFVAARCRVISCIILCSFHWRKAKGVSEEGVQNVPPGGENMLLSELSARVEGKVCGPAYNKVSTLPSTRLSSDAHGNFRGPVLDACFRAQEGAHVTQNRAIPSRRAG